MFDMNNNEEENVLEKYGRNINEDVKSRKIDPIIGRDEEIRSITRILSRKTKNKPVLKSIKLESYIIWEIGYVLYKDNMKVANKHNTKEILKPTFMLLQ